MTNITPNITLEMALYSDTAKKHNIKNIANTGHINNIKISANILEIINTEINTRLNLSGFNFRFTSFFRCFELNKKVGGSITSAHAKGLAIDLHHKTLSDRDLYKIIYSIYKSGKIANLDQLILELRPASSWVHIGFALNNPRHQFLVSPKVGKYILATAKELI